MGDGVEGECGGELAGIGGHLGVCVTLVQGKIPRMYEGDPSEDP